MSCLKMYFQGPMPIFTIRLIGLDKKYLEWDNLIIPYYVQLLLSILDQSLIF